jgi:hypothetical protein
LVGARLAALNLAWSGAQDNIIWAIARVSFLFPLPTPKSGGRNGIFKTTEGPLHSYGSTIGRKYFSEQYFNIFATLSGKYRTLHNFLVINLGLK